MDLGVNLSSGEELSLANVELSQQTEVVHPSRQLRGTKRRADKSVDEVNTRPCRVQRSPEMMGLRFQRRDKKKAVACKERWFTKLKYWDTVDPNLFSDQKTTMQKECRTKPRKFCYKGIGVTTDNCLGLRRVHDVYYKSRLRSGKGHAEYEHVVTTVSQFLRWVVSTSAFSKEDVWKEATLFRSVASHKLVSSFLDLFSTHCSPSTVRTKATCLKRVCEVGCILARDHTTRSHLNFISVVLQRKANAFRRAHRIICQRRKDVNHRRTFTRILSTSTLRINLFKRQAIAALDITMRFYSLAEKKGNGFAKQLSYSNLHSWSSNFLGLLMFVSGGQRPQVFTQIQVPTRQEFNHLEFLAEDQSFIELRVLDEKRPRYIDLPYLILPAMVLSYLKFQVQVIRPAIQERAGMNDSGLYRPLLLHTKTARGLNSKQVTTRFQAFISRQGSSCSATSMDLRRYYASIMLRCYRQRKVFPSLTEDEFLRKIAQQMNTSPEQLRRTYMSHNDSDNEAETVELVNFWGQLLRS